MELDKLSGRPTQKSRRLMNPGASRYLADGEKQMEQVVQAARLVLIFSSTANG
jgi:hypothetical protein